MKSKINVILILFLLTNLTFGQKETWKLNQEKSFISYDANHLLHAWTGINNKIKGIAKIEVQDNKIKEIAILQPSAFPLTAESKLVLSSSVTAKIASAD